MSTHAEFDDCMYIVAKWQNCEEQYIQTCMLVQLWVGNGKSYIIASSSKKVLIIQFTGSYYGLSLIMLTHLGGDYCMPHLLSSEWNHFCCHQLAL